MIIVFLAMFDLLICGYLLPFSMHILINNIICILHENRKTVIMAWYLQILLSGSWFQIKICMLNGNKYPQMSKSNMARKTIMVVIIVIPCAVTSICYVQIYRYVMKVRTQMHNHWNNGLARQKMTYDETSIHLTRWRLHIHRLLTLGYVSLLYLSWNRRHVNFRRIFTVIAW
jgi:hypothetical protein